MKSQRLSEAKEEVADNIKELLKSQQLNLDKPIIRKNLTEIEQEYLLEKVDPQIMLMTRK